MQLHFTRIPYAVTLPDGELADENYIGHAPLVCEFCGVQMVQEIEADNTLHYRHVLTGHNAFARASSCKNRHSPAGGQQSYHTLKPLDYSAPVPEWVKHSLRQRTTVRNWRCILCKHRYYGDKQCPRCHDWTSTLEA